MYTDDSTAQKKQDLDQSLQEAAMRRLKALQAKRKHAAVVAAGGHDVVTPERAGMWRFRLAADPEFNTYDWFV